MKVTTKMSRAVGQLEKIYSHLNEDFFEGTLPTPIITVQSRPGTMGHCSTARVWKRKDENTYELNIAAEVLDYPIEETLDTMIHEMVHLYCRETGIKEVSRGGKYHNGKFKEEAERRGLECYQSGAYGWNTKAGDNLIVYALGKGWSEIQITRGNTTPAIRTEGTGTNQSGGSRGSGERRPSSTRKVVCPICGQSVRATKKVNIYCGNCMLPMDVI